MRSFVVADENSRSLLLSGPLQHLEEKYVIPLIVSV